MKLTLINPPHPYLVNPHAQVSLGLAYVSASVKEHRPEVDVELLNHSGLSISESANAVHHSDVFGYTATCMDYANVVELSRLIRQRFSNSLHILGGPHPTTAADLIPYGDFEAIFVGEGEQTILQFIDDLPGGMHKSIYRSEPIENLNRLPFPDRSAYGSDQGGRVMIDQDGASTVICASRGCLSSCTFCASNAIWGRSCRRRTPINVIAEMTNVMHHHGIRNFRFSDDDFMTDRNWLNEFCQLVKPLDISWRVSVRIDRIDTETVSMMVDAGCKDFSVGVESFDINVLHALGKRITPHDIRAAVNTIYNAGGNARLLLMIGTPGETPETVRANVLGLDSLRGRFAMVSLTTFHPLPGTPIWKKPEAFGVEIVDRDYSNYQLCMYRRGTGGIEQTVSNSPIRISGMSYEHQIGNIELMRAYVASLPEHNKGL